MTSTCRSGTPVPSRRARSAPSAIRSAVRIPTLIVGARLARRSRVLAGGASPTLLLVPQRLVQVVGLVRLRLLVHDRRDSLRSEERRVGKECRSGGAADR